MLAAERARTPHSLIHRPIAIPLLDRPRHRCESPVLMPGPTCGPRQSTPNSNERPVGWTGFDRGEIRRSHVLNRTVEHIDIDGTVAEVIRGSSTRRGGN